ncbi:zona pellucida-like domain-containing protein 1 [Xyrichtys novacula]|uniref:Zona pellucida-like domain-containing protein 1 n=1 Tax=Xyrichtys novacula TaxID=13765 RepID=A0AAV1H1R9_XYRNO|nr:zona pellucida-like domain-containing protein 1 [Xyrichtys novacula]
MKIVLFLLSMILCIISTRCSQLTLSDCGAEARRPQVSDISVTCGTSSIGLAIQICPVIYTGYNDSLLILNHMLDPSCRAVLDDSVSPPVARFNFPLNMTHACGSTFRTTSAAGTGIFSDFSNIQTVNISGVVRSVDPTTGTITYNAELKYYYSCAYPLEYLVNNTQIDVSASSIAIKDNNGSFISTLSMELFWDSNFTKPLIMPTLGVELRTSIYVEVKATNLTGQYHVLLDRCYASISPLPTNSSYFNLFVPCSRDQFTKMIENGDSQSARFRFPAFRFIEQQNETVSTYYLHCITRLCETTTCSTFKQCNNRRKRSTLDTSAAGISKTYTITSSEIVTKADTSGSKEKPLHAEEEEDSAVGLGVAVGVLAFACIVALSVSAVFYKKLRN